MAAAPLNKRVEMDAKIDEAIAKIDAALPVIHQKAAQARQKSRTPSPTACFEVKNFMRTQQALSQIAREMQESSEEAEEVVVEKMSRRHARKTETA